MPDPAPPTDPLRALLREVYGDDAGDATFDAASERLAAFRRDHPGPSVPPAERVTRDDALLIAYADHVRAPGEAPLATLGRLLRGPLDGTASGVHLLPFYPSTSDDGFAVADYERVDPEVGTWADVRALGATHRLMFDAVVNHTSASHPWFEAWLAGDPRYDGHYRAEDPATDLSNVVRPRTSPLLTPFEDASGETRHVWTTFSADQVDLDYRDPRVLLDVLGVLLRYVAEGATVLRLDAVTYLWKEPGHPSVHHPNTHRVLKIVREALERAAPRVVVLTETNVPHAENVAYFGDGHDEAQMVYNFALPPLVLHTYLTGDAAPFADWAAELTTPSEATTFFNFLASHDGIGLRGVETILPAEARAALGAAAEVRGGYVSYKSDPGGGRSPYELNINYWDALNGGPDDAPDLGARVARFLGAHALMLALPGVPGIYLPSLVGSRGDRALAEATGRARSINRARLELEALERELADPEHRRSRVLRGFRALLAARRAHPAFDPAASLVVLDAPAGVVALQRESREGRRVLTLVNLRDREVDVSGVTGAGRGETLVAVGAAGEAGAAPTEGRMPPHGVWWLDLGDRSAVKRG